MVDLIALWEGSPPDINAPSENVIDCPGSTDIPDVDLWEMLTEGTRMWDEESGATYRRLLETPTDLLARFYDKVWRLVCLHHYGRCPDSLIDLLLWMVGFGPQQGSATALAELLSTDQKRLLIKIAIKLWKRRGRLDLVAEAIRLFAARIRPRIITWFWRQPRVDIATIGSQDKPATDLHIMYTEHFSDSPESDAYRTLIRVSDDGSTDRAIVEALAELNRPSHEYFEIAYVDFVDTFLDGRTGYWLTVGGTSPVYREGDGAADPPILPAVTLHPGARERVQTLTSATWHDYIFKYVMEHEAVVTALEARFYVEDDDNYYSIRFDFSTADVELWKVVATVPTLLTSVSDVDIYHLETRGVMVDVVERVDGDLRVRIYVDEILIIDHPVAGPDFTEGTVEFWVDPGSGGNVYVSYPEIFQRPLDVTTLGPV